MSSVPDRIEEQELSAFVDGRLPPERAAAVEAHLDAHPEERARLQQYREQRLGLRAAFAADTVEPIPPHLRLTRILADRRKRWNWRMATAAAALVFLILGGVGGWEARNHGIGLPPGQTAQAAATERAITADALAAHQVFSAEVRHPVEVDAAQETHLVQWLSKRLGHPLVVPDLHAAGYQLMGGRLLPSEGGPAAQFMYQNGKSRLTLYEREDTAGETGFRYSAENGVSEFYWSDQEFGYAVTAKVDRERLMKLAEMIYHQLDEGAKTKIPPPPQGKAS
jgi:anti-sigma factor RsiW